MADAIAVEDLKRVQRLMKGEGIGYKSTHEDEDFCSVSWDSDKGCWQRSYREDWSSHLVTTEHNLDYGADDAVLNAFGLGSLGYVENLEKRSPLELFIMAGRVLKDG